MCDFCLALALPCPPASEISCVKPASPVLARLCVGLKPPSPLLAQGEPQMKPPSPLRAKRSCFSCIFRLQWCCRFQWSLFGGEQWCRRFHAGLHQRLQRRHWFQSWHVAVSCARKGSPCLAWCGCEREKVLPAWSDVGVSAKKFALRTKNGPKLAFCGVLGEFFRGNAAGRGVLGESFRGPAVV